MAAIFSTSPEFDTLKQNFDKIVGEIGHNPASRLGKRLCAKNLLVDAEISDSRTIDKEKATAIVKAVLTKTKDSPQTFYTFIEVLSEYGDHYNTIVATLIQEVCEKKTGETRPTLSFLMIGKTGTGKSTLVNNILGEKIAKCGDLLHPKTKRITKYEGEVQGVTISIYDTPGLEDTRGISDEATLQKFLPRIDVIIYCFNMNQNRIDNSVISPFQQYTSIGIDWKKTIIAFTFADSVPMPENSRKSSEKRREFFLKRVEEWKCEISKILGGTHVVAVLPTTDDIKAKLDDGKPWFAPFWLAIIKALPASSIPQYLYISSNKRSKDAMKPKLNEDPSQFTSHEAKSHEKQDEKEYHPPQKKLKLSDDSENLAYEESSETESYMIQGSPVKISDSSSDNDELPDSQPFRVPLNREQKEEFCEIIKEKSSENRVLSAGAVIGGGALALFGGGVALPIIGCLTALVGIFKLFK